MKKVCVLAVVALASIPILACGPDYQEMEISGHKASPLGGTVQKTNIEVPEGMIVKVHVVPKNDDGEEMQAHVFSRDPEMLEVTAIVNDRDYAFIGKRPGNTVVEFQADGETVLLVNAVVTPQPPPDQTTQP